MRPRGGARARLRAARAAPRSAPCGRRAQGDKRAYAEAARLPGLAVDSKQRGSQPTPLAIFKQLCFKWEKRMAGVLTSCLASKADGFVHRTVLLYLKKVVAVRATGYPAPNPRAGRLLLAAAAAGCGRGLACALSAGGPPLPGCWRRGCWRPWAPSRQRASARGGGAASLLGSARGNVRGAALGAARSRSGVRRNTHGSLKPAACACRVLRQERLPQP
jgi:hypothetical protein